MVMEFLIGSDLARLLRDQGVLGVEDAIDYIAQGSEAIVEAHGLGIVHRDLKPANLFLDARADGSPLVKVLDFGISKMANGAVDVLTGTDAALGSALLHVAGADAADALGGSPDGHLCARRLALRAARRQAAVLRGDAAAALRGGADGHADAAAGDPSRRARRARGPCWRRRTPASASTGTRRSPSFIVSLAPFAPARTYPTLARIARMGGLSLHAAIPGGQRASQPSFPAVDSRLPGPAAREPSWPELASSGRAARHRAAAPADAAPPRDAVLAGAVAHRPRLDALPAPVVAVFALPVAGQRRLRACPAEDGRPSPIPPNGFPAPTPQQQIVPGPYSAPMSSRAAATFASSTHLGISSTGAGSRAIGLPFRDPRDRADLRDPPPGAHRRQRLHAPPGRRRRDGGHGGGAHGRRERDGDRRAGAGADPRAARAFRRDDDAGRADDPTSRAAADAATTADATAASASAAASAPASNAAVAASSPRPRRGRRPLPLGEARLRGAPRPPPARRKLRRRSASQGHRPERPALSRQL